jgi:hypothetical protein
VQPLWGWRAVAALRELHYLIGRDMHPARTEGRGLAVRVVDAAPSTASAVVPFRVQCIAPDHGLLEYAARSQHTRSSRLPDGYLAENESH